MKYLTAVYIIVFAIVFIINAAVSENKDDALKRKNNRKTPETETKSQNEDVAASEIKDDGMAGKSLPEGKTKDQDKKNAVSENKADVIARKKNRRVPEAKTKSQNEEVAASEIKDDGMAEKSKPEGKTKSKNKKNESNDLMGEKSNGKKTQKKRRTKNRKHKSQSRGKKDFRSFESFAQLFVGGFQNNFDNNTVTQKGKKTPSLILGPVGKIIANEFIKEIRNITGEVMQEDKGENGKKSSSDGKLRSGSSGLLGKMFISEIHNDFENLTVADSTKPKKRPIWSLGPIGRMVAKEVVREVLNMTDQVVEEVRVENRKMSTMQTTPAAMKMSTVQTTQCVEDEEISSMETTPTTMEMSTIETTLDATEKTTSEANEMSTIQTTPDDTEMSCTSTTVATVE